MRFRRTLATLVIAGAASTVVAGVAGAATVTLRPGMVGSLRVDHATRAAVQRVAGALKRTRTVDNARGAGHSRYLGYGTCLGTVCTNEYWISGTTKRLSDFRTTSKRFRTVHGTTIGTSTASAIAREHRALQPAAGCIAQAMVITTGRGQLWLGFNNDRVTLMYVTGLHPVIYPCTSG